MDRKNITLKIKKRISSQKKAAFYTFKSLFGIKKNAWSKIIENFYPMRFLFFCFNSFYSYKIRFITLSL